MAALRPSAADPRWETRAAATGITFVVLAVIGLLFAPDLPKSDDSNDDVFSYFSDNDTRIVLGGSSSRSQVSRTSGSSARSQVCSVGRKATRPAGFRR